MDREFWLRGLVEVGRLRDGERVLDLGAGTGRFAQLLSTTNRVVALDSSDAMLRIAREKGPFECVEDRKSTRLNSSHVRISYAVFCLKKTTNTHTSQLVPRAWNASCC